MDKILTGLSLRLSAVSTMLKPLKCYMNVKQGEFSEKRVSVHVWATG